MMSKKSPQLRFEGFTDDWEERKFSDFTKLSQGLQIAISDRFTEAGPNKEFYITNEFLNPNNTKKYYIENPSKNVIANKNDILMTRTGNTGKVVTNTKGAFHNNFFKIDYDPQKISKLFLYFLLTSIPIQKEILIRAGTSTIPDLNHKDFYNIKVYLPIFEEQQRIGSFFKQLDDTIALHQRKLDLLKEQKKGYLQKMSPKNGAKVPELRFAGFADAWEERKLGELSNIVGGGTPSTSNTEYWDGDIDWYAPAEIGEQSYVSKSKKTITELGLKKSSARILPIGTVLFTSRAGIGNTAILAKEATTNQGFQSIVPDQNKLDSYFIFSRTNELKRYGEVTGAGSIFVEVLMRNSLKQVELDDGEGD